MKIMKTVSIPLTEMYLKKMEEIIEKERIHTNSEFVRLAIRELLERDEKILKKSET